MRRKFKDILFEMIISGRNLTRVGGKCSRCIDVETVRRCNLVVSAGAGLDVSFEEELVLKYGAKILIFDPSPTGIKTCERVFAGNCSVNFYEFGLAGKSGFVSFAAPLESDGESFQPTKAVDHREMFRFECKSLSEVVREHQIGQAGLLKIDIEGSEYGVLVDLIKNHPRLFPQIALEFHHKLPGMNPWKQRLKTLLVILRLRLLGYSVVWKSGGDFTFLRS